MALGGLMVGRKGIDTKEGYEMADKKFQLDEDKADLDNDGELSSYEKARGEAVQKLWLMIQRLMKSQRCIMVVCHAAAKRA